MSETFDVVVTPDRPCPICQGARFVWGRLRDSEGRPLSFIAEGRSFLGALAGDGKGPAFTRMCLNCRHLDTFVGEGWFKTD